MSLNPHRNHEPNPEDRCKDFSGDLLVKSTELVYCTITRPCLRMRHRPSARHCTDSEHLPTYCDNLKVLNELQRKRDNILTQCSVQKMVDDRIKTIENLPPIVKTSDCWMCNFSK